MNSIGDATKKRLKSVVLELRRLLEDDLARELKRLGVDSARDEAIPISKLSYLTDREQAIREAIDAALAKEQALAGSFVAAVEGLRREAAYTHLNRLVGLKCLELRGHLVIDGEPTETVTCRPEFGDRPKWLWTLRDRDNRYRYGEEAEELLWREGLTRACEAVTAEIHLLFDPADPHAQVWPSHKTLRSVVTRLNQLPEDTYRTDELLGWVYQYFQSEEKQLVTAGNSFTQSLLNTKKYIGPDVATYTALYTERYMVDFLLQNSLGARWMEMYPDSPLTATWPYYVTPAAPHTRPPKPLKDWTILDPCVGSGHFLVVAFDLLVQLYAEERRLAESGRITREWPVPEPEVARTIVERNLFGIDIDSRAVQIAAVALYLKDKEYGFGPTDRPPRLNLVAADAVLTRGTAYKTLLAQYKQDSAACEAIEAIWHALEHVRDLGSLVRVEEEVDAAVRKAKMKEDRHSPLLSSAKDWDAYKQTLFNRLQTAFDAEAQSADVTARIFGREGEKGVGLVELLSRRYDVVCTNPPYMGSKNMGPMLKAFVAKHYASGKRDLYASFILRCRELAEKAGHVAMVTQQSWMFSSGLVPFRSASSDPENGQRGGILRTCSLDVLAHVGPGGFTEISGEVVNTVLLVFRPELNQGHNQAVALRVVEEASPADKAKLLREQPLTCRHEFNQPSILRIPGTPVAYWLNPTFYTLLSAGKTLNQIVDVYPGLKTGADARFLRFHWEIPNHGLGWVPYSKGGKGYGKWYGQNEYCADWRLGKQSYREYRDSRQPYSEFYFKDGYTYSSASKGALSIRHMPPGAIFGSKGPGVFPRMGTWPIAILNSRLSSYFIRSMTVGLDILVENVRAIPLPEIDENVKQKLGLYTEFSELLQRSVLVNIQTDIGFRCTPKVALDNLADTLRLTFECLVERLVCKLYDLEPESIQKVYREVGEQAGENPLIAGYDALPNGPAGLPPIPQEWIDYITTHKHISPAPEELTRIKNRLSALYIAGPGAKVEDAEEEATGSDGEADDDEEDDTVALAARIPIPAETFLEELSQKIAIHPISVYWLLDEMRREEGLICPPELKRHTEDYFSVKLLRMLGHRWPLQNQYEQDAGRPFLGPEWIDTDGIMPLALGTGEETLIERFRRFLDAEFGPERGPSVEIEAGQILGWKPGDLWGQQKSTTLARWFERDFFKRHVSQFKRRPIAWHLTSPKGTFQTIVYYHAFDKNRLTLLRARYVREALESLRKQLGEAQGAGTDRQALARVADIEVKIADVQSFDERLRRLLEGRDREARIWCPWKRSGEQPVGWDPDINDGVRVNIAPVQRLGLLAANVLSAKDLKSLLAPEGRS